MGTFSNYVLFYNNSIIKILSDLFYTNTNRRMVFCTPTFVVPMSTSGVFYDGELTEIMLGMYLKQCSSVQAKIYFKNYLKRRRKLIWPVAVKPRPEGF